MADLYKGKIPVVRRDLNEGFLRGTPDAEHLSTGCIPRDFSVDPVRMGDSPSGMTTIPDSDWDAWYDQQEATKSSLEHIYLGDGDTPAFQFLDQNGFPDCWAHSTAHAIMLDRARQGLPPVRLNAVAVATLLRQTNGGWCGLSMKFAREHGYPVIGTGPGEWPYQSRRGQDTPELRASMAMHKSVEDWYDLGRAEYDQRETKPQFITCLFNNHPTPSDYNRASHSMLSLRWVRIERGHWGILTLNSWQQFGCHGLCVLSTDDGWFPDNACSLRASTSSTK